MRSQMATRTKAVLLLGFLIFAGGGAGAVYLVTRDGPAPPSTVGQVQAFYAVQSVDAGTSGATALASGVIRSKPMAPAALPPDSVTDPSQLSGKVAAAAIPAGTLLTTDMFPAPQTRIGTVVIPPGKRALALQLEHVPGVAGFVGSGDRIDVYAVGRGAEGAAQGVRLVLQSVEVLNVNGLGLPAAQGQAGGGPLVYLLAVTPNEAERLIYLTEFEKLYLDLVAKGEAPVATPGAGPNQALQAL